MRFVIGVDGGGTRSRAVVLDERGVEIGRAEGLGSVVTQEAPEDAVRSVSEAVRSAVDRTGLALPGAVLWAGLAGAGREEARRSVSDALASTGLADRVHVGTDAEATFQDAFGDGPGILLIAGTGSIVWGCGNEGVWVRVGGWGQHIGDEGSGYAIGVAALQHVLRARDGRDPPTRMTEHVLEQCGVGDAAHLVEWIGSASKGEVAALVPIVAEAAARLDSAAVSILESAVAELESHVSSVLERTGPWEAPAPLVVWGGLLAEGGALRSATLQALERYPVSVSDVELDPPHGAATLALRHL